MLQIILDLGTWNVLGREISLRVFGYGLMMVFGFIIAILLCKWRAKRMGESTEAVTAIGILAIIGGVAGSRIAYIIQNWERFSSSPGEIFDITSGGLIYYGGVIGAMFLVLIYLRAKKLPVRRYLDILAVSMMVGLAFGRMGCFLNGCCYGAQCSHDSPFAMRFPMYSKPLLKLDSSPGPFSSAGQSPSPLYLHQLEKGIIKPDPRLAFLQDPHIPLSTLSFHGKLTGDQLVYIFADEQTARHEFSKISSLDSSLGKAEFNKAIADGSGYLRGSENWEDCLTFDSDRNRRIDFSEMTRYQQARKHMLLAIFDNNVNGRLDPEEKKLANEWLSEDLYELALSQKTLPAKPAQILGIINALVLAGICFAFFRIRRREGQVFALVLILYPITRFLLEGVRSDTALHMGLTHNQYTSIITCIAGIAFFISTYFLPASASLKDGERLQK